MNDTPEFDAVFSRLRAIMSGSAGELICVRDVTGDYYLDTPFFMKNKKRLFFGAVQTRRKYVSYHLMPVYVFPGLLDGISPELMRRMQGKSCFNFRVVDDGLFGQLARLTERGLESYREAGYLRPGDFQDGQSK